MLSKKRAYRPGVFANLDAPPNLHKGEEIKTLLYSKNEG